MPSRLVRAAIPIIAVASTLGIIALLDWRADHHAAQAGFWFEDVTFDSPRLAPRLGSPITSAELRDIKSIATSELVRAFSGVQVSFSESRTAFYRVRVVSSFSSGRTPSGRGPAAAGASQVLGPLGGNGSVNFLIVADRAVSHAPPQADRAAIIEGIGRGIGRAAVHEFAHQMLPGVQIHASKDPASYEYETADRATQYYGSLHWGFAWPLLIKRLGPSEAPPP